MLPGDQLFEAASFAARAHRHQIRKDGHTPYFAHPFRVCLVVRQVFGIDDPKVLMAALLHDTIEDTTTDYDDLLERFGPDVAGWVAALTKDMRMEETPREAEYIRVLAAAGWQVMICKLADIYDNIADSQHLKPSQRSRTLGRSTMYMDAVRSFVPPEAAGAFAIVERKLAEFQRGISE